MRRVFQSATLKLTTWYLLILVVISVVFSIIIFEISTSEISSRLERLQIRVEGTNRTVTLPGPLTLNDVRVHQTEEARRNIFFGLLYMNVAVAVLGGIGAFLLARRTLKPIEELHEAQSRFTSDASHELRTPLAVMKSEIQVTLRDPSAKREELKQLLQSNLEEVDKLTELSETLLQLSRLEDGDLQRSDKVDMNKEIHQALRSFNFATSRTKLTIPDHPIMIEGNRPMIGDLIRILLDNATKYSPKDSVIQVNLGSNGRLAKLSIFNEGDGIPAKDLPHIFDRFYRSDTSRTSTHTKGYGLGLSLARKIVEVHDGTISAQSTPGERTRFTVSLPQLRLNR